MGNAGAKEFGMEEAPVTVEDSCNGMVEVFDKSTKEEYGGKMWLYSGEQAGW